MSSYDALLTTDPERGAAAEVHSRGPIGRSAASSPTGESGDAAATAALRHAAFRAWPATRLSGELAADVERRRRHERILRACGGDELQAELVAADVERRTLAGAAV